MIPSLVYIKDFLEVATTLIRGIILLEEGILLEALLAISYTIVLLEALTKFSSL
jgi:hypothetical protein